MSTPEDQQAEREYQSAKEMTDDELVHQMFRTNHKSYLRESLNVSYSLSYFSILMTRYSEESKKSSEVNEKLQRSMLWLSRFVVVLTVVLLLTIPQINNFVFGHSDDAPQQSQNDTPNNNPSNHINPPLKN
ncbi:hypothetical protein [Pelagicoccus sp. SDUM812002]|uniref:hypothetical protein n=1 Tax=Pelagicoccus sp. SDUM812002 TaxID=3041266 RepID=UPI00280E1BFC|nr:hypothetical protein [Pelagicoccus sp. SDUM812002]MDQ8188574.1 hypothetical protein [Pelagicoccus sp. SDUM812002]